MEIGFKFQGFTFEELMGMFEAKQIDFDDLPDDPNDNFNNASAVVSIDRYFLRLT